ncbi:RNA-directed DNA polymerase [Salinivibrio sp. ES.052]|uniref:RNA-directed DNA polymerase n=1 Tax=Salinivibrio sp. ES.052 TaxID=1882823 RepID=UPI00092B964E|nr:RNA-directed DNA polymerase [Salinivibrio sp. ES.052]SIN97095.1 Reverse transcriptase (RNA-dependent DNA polymerase) [Salinivibrio sp. ES.052]
MTSQSISNTFTLENLRRIYIDSFSQTKVTGVDNILPKHFSRNQNEELSRIVSKVYFEEYKFTRYKEKLILKGANKLPRQIAIPTLRDRITLKTLQGYLHRRLSDRLSMKVPQQVTREVKLAINSEKYEKVIKIDIKDFYPSIDHSILEEKLKVLGIEKEAITLIESAVKNGFKKKSLNECGIPQGLSISNILAEIYFLELDESFKGRPFFYKRYVDDVLIFCSSSSSEAIYKEFKDKVESINLSIHEKNNSDGKTEVKSILNEFSYLGYLYNCDVKTKEVNKKEKTNISVRGSSRKRFQDSIASIFTLYANAGKKKSKALLFWKLNLRITGCISNGKRKGWLFFFSEMNDMPMLFEMDNMIKNLCARHRVEYKGVKKLTRAIHVIKHEKWESSYFPNFDEYNYKSMREVVAYDRGTRPHKVKLTDQDLKSAFWSIINREVRAMETDITSFS